MNTRAALYGSLHMISIASRAVTKVLEPVHLRLFIAPEAIVWVCTRTELRSSWKARHRSSPPQICCSSKKSRGRGDTQVRSREGVHLFLDHAASSYVRIELHAGVDCPAPETGKRRGFPPNEWGKLRVSHPGSRPGSFRALKICKLYISPIEISREKKPARSMTN